MILEPIGDSFDVVVGWTIKPAEFLGREPMVEITRFRIQLPGHECSKSGFLLGAALEDQDHAFHG